MKLTKRFLCISAVLELLLVLCALMHYKPEFFADTVTITDEMSSSAPRGQKFNRSHKHTEFGYVLAMTYFDQLTGSKMNLMSMQCWAGTLGPKVRVVEPFVVHATFGVNMSDIIETQSDAKTKGRSGGTKLGDIFNKKEWGATVEGLAPLSSWEYFIDDAPRNLIIINKDCIKTVRPLMCSDCSNLIDSLQFKQSVAAFAKHYGFEIVRNICIPASKFTSSKFNELVYGSYDSAKVVVLFEYWGGVDLDEYSLRMIIYNIRQCMRLGYRTTSTPLSSQIIKDGEKYVQKHMPSADTKGYIAVMVRTQYVAYDHKYFPGWSMEKVADFYKTKCYSALLKEVNEMKKKHAIDSVMLSMDCRKQGSYYFRDSTELSQTIANSSAILFHDLYGNSSTLLQWDQAFDEVSTSKNPGYLAILQKHLAANSTCLLTVGSGTFQETARNMYKLYHNGRPMCLKNISC